MDPAQNQPKPIAPVTPSLNVSSTEISLSEAKKLEHGASKKKKKLFIVIGACIMALILIVGLFGLISSRMRSKPAPIKKVVKPTPTPVSTILPIDRNNNQQILFGYVPHFLDLKLSDLPSVRDIRGIFNYKKNVIIVAATGITEYDPKTNNIIRQNDQRLFQCINYATLIENTLYIACNGIQKPAGIYAVDLENGKITKVYKKGTADLTYATVTNSGNTLWVGAKNKIVKINTKTDAMEEFSPKDVGIADCQYFMVHAYNKTVWATCVSPTTAGIAVYDEKTNTWKVYPAKDSSSDPIYTLGYSPNSIYFLSYTDNPTLYIYNTQTKAWENKPSEGVRLPSSTPLANEMRTKLQDTNVIFPGIEQKGIAYLSYYDTLEKKVKDFELTLSDYTGISDIVAQKRYLFTQNAVDSVKEKQFPASFKRLSSPVGIGTKTFVDPFENYAVLIGSSSAATPPFTAYLIELKKGTVTDLNKDNKSFQYVEPETFQRFVTDLPNTRLFGTANDATMANISGKEILKIDFQTKTMTFNRY